MQSACLGEEALRVKNTKPRRKDATPPNKQNHIGGPVLGSHSNKLGYAWALAIIYFPNVPDHLLPLAFGTKACCAGDVPKVPKAWELGASVCSVIFVRKAKQMSLSLCSRWRIE